MSKFTILNSTQADQVRGKTSEWTALDPIQLADGETYALPLQVLEDPAHAMHHELLVGLPLRELTEDDFPPQEEFLSNNIKEYKVDSKLNTLLKSEEEFING